MTELVKEWDQMGHQQVVIGGVYEEDKVVLPKNVRFFPVYFRSRELPFAITGMSDEMPYESTRYSEMTEAMTDQFTLAFGSVLRRVIETFQPDLVICHHLYFLGALIREWYPQSRLCGICHGSDLRQIKKNPWQRAYIMEQVRKFDRIFALHKEQKAQICAYYGCDVNLVDVIGTGYNSDLFYRMEDVQAEKNSATCRYIFAGKLSEKKGVKSLLKALHFLKEPEKAEVYLAGGFGNQTEYEEIKALAQTAPCRVEFLGKLAQRDLAEEMNKSDVFVLPSFFEGLPLVNIEAMACGLRVVCTDLPGIRDWMGENLPNHGAVFVELPRMENEDEAAAEELPELERRLAEAMEEAYHRPQVERKVVERLSWKSLAKRILRVLEEHPAAVPFAIPDGTGETLPQSNL